MDISVSRLNKRMALQLPAEFPLGLVFVVGKVRNLTNTDGEGGLPFFYLAENDHMLRCHLSERALQESSINEGDMIRAGGHLAFDILQADYFLLARDIEVLPEHRPSRTTLAPILADIKKRSEAASLVPAELPDWVQQIAPLEFQQSVESMPPETTADQDSELLDLLGLQDAKAVVEPTAESSPTPTKTAAPKPVTPKTSADNERPLPEGLTDDLVAFLSEAMDSPEDIELTQDMVAELAPAIKPEKPLRQPARLPQNGRPAPQTVPAETETRIPWVVVVLVFFILLTFLSLILILALFAAR